MLDVGVDLVTVQKTVGHSDPKTTARYDRRPEAAKRGAASCTSLGGRGSFERLVVGLVKQLTGRY